MATTGRTDSAEFREGDERAHQLALEKLDRPEFRGRSWADAEPELRRAWEKDHDDKPWDDFADIVRGSWERMTNEGSDEADRRRFDEESGGDRGHDE